MQSNDITTLVILAGAAFGAYYVYENWTTLFPAAPITPAGSLTTYTIGNSTITEVSPGLWQISTPNKQGGITTTQFKGPEQGATAAATAAQTGTSGINRIPASMIHAY